MMFESSQGLLSSQSTDPSSNLAKSRDAQPMYPVTVKQIAESTLSNDANFLIDGVDVYNVKLVGMVFNKVERITDVSFVTDDGTGRISCNKWVNDSQDTKDVNELMDGVYVRIHGHLKKFQGKKQIVVYAIRPVTDYNEIANHFLECIHAHCLHSKLQTSASSSYSSAVATPNGNQADTPKGNQAVSSTQFSQDGLGTIHKMILDFLQQTSSIAQETGTHQNEIAQKLKVPQEKIMEALAFLLEEGLIYSSIDEFHYKVI